jgi:diguanylate cyclase (GGDEF)-like protein
LRIAYLLSPDVLRPVQQWRLVSSLYGQKLSLVEASSALIAINGICALRTGWLGFAALAGATLVVLALRLLHIASYHHVNSWGLKTNGRDPEAWARAFTVGAAATALLWSLTEIWVILGFDDPPLQLLTLLTLAGWMGVVVTRNAASPAVIYCQTFLPSFSCVIALALEKPGFVQIVIPFILLHLAATLATAHHLGIQSINMMDAEQALAEANEQLHQLSLTDSLTGIANRRALDSQLTSVWALSMREPADVALLMIDVDHFKLYNDCYGHLAGDECLRAIAAWVAGVSARGSDFAARYGGEEFAVLLPGTTEEGARDVAERLRQVVMIAGLPHATSPFGQVTVSIGVASIAPVTGDDPAVLITLADRALYDAKSAGRNQVRCAADRLVFGPFRMADPGLTGRKAATSLRMDPVDAARRF